MHTRRFTAFISYRHADNTQEGRRWAEWLHRALERYTVPPDLIGTPNLRGEPIRDSLYPIFRDEDELPANADLATGIRAALEVSDHLVVLCSPRSAVSPWVRKEVREFKELGRSDRILAIIIAGEPNADDPAKAREGILRDEECFCEELRFGAVGEDGTLDWTIRTEPLAADLRPNGTRAEGFVTAEAYREYLTLNSSLTPEKIAARVESYRQQLDHGLLKVIAGLLGVPLGQLVDRDAAHRAALARKELERSQAESARLRGFNHRLAIAGVVALMLAVVAGWFWWRARQEKSQAEIARKAAEDARDAAEGLVIEAVHGLRAKLFALGRLDIAEDIVTASDGYYHRLPQSLITLESERHRASLLLNRAMIAAALGQDEAHERFAKAALEITMRLAKENPERGDVQKEACYAMLNLCKLEHDRADYHAALTLADQVVVRCEDWRKHEPLVAWAYHYEVLAHDLAGQVLVRRMGKTTEGMMRLARASVAAKNLRNVAGETADTCEAEGLIHYSEGKIAQKLNHHEQASAAYEAAALSFSKCLELGGDSSLVRELQAGAIHHAGVTLREVARKPIDPTKRKRGEDMVRRAFELRGKLVALEPAREEWWRDLGWSYAVLADIASEARDTEAELMNHRDCVRCRTEAINRHPERALLYEERAGALAALSDALARQTPYAAKEPAELILASLQDWQNCLGQPQYQLTHHGIGGNIVRLGSLVAMDRQAGVEWLAKARASIEPLLPKLAGKNDARECYIKLLVAQQENFASLGREHEAETTRMALHSWLENQPDKLMLKEWMIQSMEQEITSAKNAKDWGRAENLCKKRLAIWKEITASNQARPIYFGSLILAHLQLAEVVWAQSRRADAFDIAKQGLEVAEPWLGKLNELQDRAGGVPALLHWSAAMHSEQKHFDEADAAFKKALYALTFLVETFPGKAGYLDGLASTYESIRHHHGRTGNKAAREQALKSAIPLRERILQAEPNHADWNDKLARDYQDLGDLCKDAGNREKALPLYERALQTWTTLAGIRADNPDVIGRQCLARERMASLMLDSKKPDDLARARQLLDEAAAALHELETRGQLNDERRNWQAAVASAQARL